MTKRKFQATRPRRRLANAKSVKENIKKMTKEESLSDFIEEDMYIGHPDNKEEVEKSGELLCIPLLKAKEKIQNAQRRIKEVINMEWGKGMKHILNEIEEIYKDEFGDKLI